MERVQNVCLINWRNVQRVLRSTGTVLAVTEVLLLLFFSLQLENGKRFDSKAFYDVDIANIY